MDTRSVGVLLREVLTCIAIQWSHSNPMTLPSSKVSNLLLNSWSATIIKRVGNPVGRFYGPGLEIANSFLPTPNGSHTGETGACCLPRHTGRKEKCLLNTNQSLPQFGCTHNSENMTFFMGKCSYEKFPEWTGKFPKIPSTLNHSFIYASITNPLPMHSLLYSLHVY